MANRQLLARATEGTSAPTPGYLYNDLSQAAQSSPTAATEMAEYLVNRLQNTHNVHTKTKCLTVIAKLCDSTVAFKRSLAQRPHNTQALKDALRHAGPPDAVCGDALNQKVRQAAQQAMDAVYRADPPAASAAAPSMMMGSGGGGNYSSHSPAYASNGYGNNNNAHNNNARRMEGIGNPRYKDPRLEPAQPTTIQDVAREAGDVILGMIKDPLARNHHVGRHGNLPPPSPNKYSHGGGGGGYIGNGGRVGELYGGPNGGGGHGGYSTGHGFAPPPGAAELAQQTGGQWTMASNRGPNAVVPRTEREQDHYYPQQQQSSGFRASQGGVGGSWGATGHSAPSIVISSVGGPGAATSHSMPHSAPASDGTYEKNLILELCPPGGMKAVPPADRLASFAKMLPSLNADLVCPVLLDCLEEGQPWIVRAKALCVMETCLRSGNTVSAADGSNMNPYGDFFHACQGEIVPLTAHPRAQIKDPAKRVVALMGGAEAAFEVPAATVPATVVNLLDFDDEPAPVAPAPTSAPPSAPTSQDMFGGMQVKAKSEAAVTAGPSQSNGSVISQEASLLDLVNDPVGDAPSNNSADIFRDMGVKETQTPSHMFQNMTLMDRGGEDKKSDSEDAGDFQSMMAPGSGSAFGFINGGGSTDEQGQMGGGKPNFDPLSAPPASPGVTAKAIMPMMQSPEQMQAMAYQQMLMQQRMQMQMAYAMQQQGGGGRPMPFAAGMGSPTGMPNLPMLNANGAGNAFARPAKTDDHKFDFVKDAMKTQSKK